MSELPPSQKIPDPRKALYERPDFTRLGESAGGNPIMAKRLNKGKDKRALLIGGVHGNETEGVAFMRGFCDEFANSDTFPTEVDLMLIPVLNPDGVLGYQRGNARGVDLNRNLPTKDWTPEYTESKYYPGTAPGSEPENQILVRILEEFQPDYIISFHSWKPMINTNGPAKKFAEAIYAKLPMVISDDIGYPTPGSLGTYAGWEREIPTITLEFERGKDLNLIYPESRNAIIESLRVLLT